MKVQAVKEVIQTNSIHPVRIEKLGLMVNGRVAWFDSHSHDHDTSDHYREFLELEEALKKIEMRSSF